MTFAKGDYSHAEGQWRVAYGSNSHAEGEGSDIKRYFLTGEANATTFTYSLNSSYDMPEINDVIFDQFLGTKVAKIIDINSVNSILTLDSPISNEAITNKGYYAYKAAIGAYSHAEGQGTKATGHRSHAEGSHTIAFGDTSHAEGAETKAVGQTSHAEGISTVAYGNGSHAEGGGTNYMGCTISGEANSLTYTMNDAVSFELNTIVYCEGRYAKIVSIDRINKTITVDNTLNPNHALNNTHIKHYTSVAAGEYSHVEGLNNIAVGNQQHVQGKYNTPDIESIYAHIIGNGTNDYSRSNAHTVDWNGNAWYSGEIFVGGTRQSEGTMLAHQSKILEVSVPSASLVSGTEYSLSAKTLYPNDIIEIKPDYTKDTSAEYREAIRKANFGSRLGKIWEYDDGRADYNCFIIPDGEIDSSITAYYFLIINHGPGGAW